MSIWKNLSTDIEPNFLPVNWRSNLPLGVFLLILFNKNNLMGKNQTDFISKQYGLLSLFNLIQGISDIHMMGARLALPLFGGHHLVFLQRKTSIYLLFRYLYNKK